MYILNGTDPEGDPVRYGLTFDKGSKEYFRVDSKSGNVTLIQELDREVNSYSFFFIIIIIIMSYLRLKLSVDYCFVEPR